MKITGKKTAKIKNQGMCTVEKLYQEAIALPPDDLRRLIEMLSKVEAPQQAMSKKELMLELKNAGLISKLLASPSRRRKRQFATLIKVQGKPLSDRCLLILRTMPWKKSTHSHFTSGLHTAHGMIRLMG